MGLFMADVPLLDLKILDTQIRELADYFGLKTREDRLEYADSLKEVLDWAQSKTKSQFISDVILTIRSVEKNLIRNASEPKLHNLRRYIYLEGEQARLDSDKAAILKKPEENGPTPS